MKSNNTYHIEVSHTSSAIPGSRSGYKAPDWKAGRQIISARMAMTQSTLATSARKWRQKHKAGSVVDPGRVLNAVERYQEAS